jgi:hypothetical protein
MRKAYLRSARPQALIGIKLWTEHSLREDARLLVELTRYFWWIPRFWAVSFPWLLMPHQAVKAMSRAKWAAVSTRQGVRARRATHHGR